MTSQQEIKYLKKQIEFLSKNYVTGLYGRHRFMLELRKKFETKEEFFLSMHDVDGLHEVNRISGYSAGDSLLREVANDLQLCEDPCHPYHIGGDEFFVMYCSEPIEYKCPNTTSEIVNSIDFMSVDEMIDALDKKVSDKKLKTKRRRRDDI